MVLLVVRRGLELEVLVAPVVASPLGVPFIVRFSFSIVIVVARMFAFATLPPGPALARGVSTFVPLMVVLPALVLAGQRGVRVP